MRKPIESAATRQLQRSAPDELKAALKSQLAKILEGDLTLRMLLELEQTAALAHKMLLVAGEPRAVRGAHRFGPYGGGLGMVGGLGDMVVPDDLDNPIGGPLAPAPFGAPENFGAEMIRNMVSSVQAPKLDDLMRSIEAATELAKNAPNPTQKAKYDAWIEALQAQIDAKLEDAEPGGLEVIAPPHAMLPGGGP